MIVSLCVSMKEKKVMNERSINGYKQSNGFDLYRKQGHYVPDFVPLPNKKK